MANKSDLKEIKRGQIGTGLLIENDGYCSLQDTKSNKLIKEDFERGRENGEWHVPYPFVVDCVLQKHGIKNANGRIYGERILKREVERYQTAIKERRALGELDHPADSTISLKTISHNIIECHWEGATLVGKLELNTTEGFRKLGICSSQGDSAANLLLNGYKIGISSRAVGSVETDSFGNTIVGEDLELLGWDIVSSPSTPGAWLGEKEELRQYVEAKEIDSNKSKLTEKISILKNILR